MERMRALLDALGKFSKHPSQRFDGNDETLVTDRMRSVLREVAQGTATSHGDVVLAILQQLQSLFFEEPIDKALNLLTEDEPWQAWRKEKTQRSLEERYAFAEWEWINSYLLYFA